MRHFCAGSKSASSRCPSARVLATLEPEHQALRKRAARLWFLIVHREALGLRHYESLYELYQIPRSLVPNP